MVRQAGQLLGFVALIWVIEVFNGLFGHSLSHDYGLVPRELSRLPGIALMPLLHGSMAHAAANTLPIIALGLILVATTNRNLWTVNIMIVTICGAIVWIFGREAIHVGASGLIFGWLAFLIFRGIVDREPVPLIISIVVALVYGSALWGVVPGGNGVSWEAHLAGVIAGLCAALFIPVQPIGALRR